LIDRRELDIIAKPCLAFYLRRDRFNIIEAKGQTLRESKSIKRNSQTYEYGNHERP
jgi:hypothetical protein